jgi:hypothetical protein
MVDRGSWTVDEIISQTGDDPQSNTLEPEGVDPRTLAPNNNHSKPLAAEGCRFILGSDSGPSHDHCVLSSPLDHSLKSACLSGFGMIATVFGLLPMEDPNVIDI